MHIFVIMIYILDLINDELVGSEIVAADYKALPLKKDGWVFNWKQLAKEGDVYILRTLDSFEVQGAICLRIEYNMLVMDALELAPFDFGRTNKRFDYVTGCLIAFGCRESFKIKGYYKGFLTFVSKTSLIQWYIDKYGAELALGQRMFIDWKNGEKLIEEYLNRKK